MPRTPEVCPTAFCPLSQLSNTVSSVLRILSSASHQLLPAFCPLPTAFCLLPSAFCLLLFLVTHHSSLITVRAQGATATLSGTVTDQNGAVVPGVNVAVINLSQGFQRTTTTNSEGIFVVPLLPPANYTVKAEHQGFTTAELRDVVLSVNNQAHLRILLKVGRVDQTVDVIDGGSLISESPAVGTVVDRQFVANIPLNGRSFQSLITLTPGIVAVPSSMLSASSPGGGFDGQFSVNGQRANANIFTVDGVSANVGNGVGFIAGEPTSGTLPGLTTFGGTNSLVSIDALQEFQVQTSTYSAEYGRSPGGQVSMVTRSGENEFHGTVFEYLRNDVFDANDWFLNSRGLKKAALRQNDFGGVLGGPILLPRFGEGGRQPWYNGRNKTFFFLSYEGLRLRTPQFALTNVPSLTLRQTAAAGIRPILNAFPLPNGPILANGFAEFAASYSDSSTLNATSIRLDYTFSNRLTLFGRYNNAPSQGAQRDAPVNLSRITFTELKPQTVTVGATMILAPNITNEIRANYSDNKGRFGSEQDAFGGAQPVARDVLLLPQYAPAGSNANAGAVFVLPGLSVPVTPQVGPNNLTTTQRQLNIVDNFSFTTGAHQLKFGADYRRLTPIISPRAYILSLLFLSQAQVLSGTAQIGNVGAGVETRPIYNEFSVFAQDNWKLSGRLTLNLGLRWDVNPAPAEANGNDPLAIVGLDNLATLAVAPQGTPLWKTTYNNFGPRLGAAYQLSQKPGRETVLRGGFGVFYDTGNSQGSAGFSFFPFAPSRVVPNVSLPLSAAQVAPPAFTRNPPYLEFATFDPNLKLPYTLQWNLAVQQSLGKNQTLTTSYVGAAGRRLLVQQRLNLAPINPSFASNIRLITNDSTSDYHSLQLQFQRRLSRGLQALASYTWAHAIDTASFDAVDSSSPVVRGNSNFDIRHNFAAAVTYDIPRPKWNRAANAVLSDWSIDTRINVQSSLPFNIVAGTIIDPISRTQFARRANLITGVPIYLNNPNVPGGRIINRAAFSIPATGVQGTLGRNIVRGFSSWQVDLALRRQFNLKEKLKLQFRAEAFNIFNHPNFGTINPDLTSTSFGQATRMLGRQLGGLNPLYQIGGPRSLQFALKLSF
jgi:outer membrane receptor protein involved in Fe transport